MYVFYKRNKYVGEKAEAAVWSVYREATFPSFREEPLHPYGAWKQNMNRKRKHWHWNSCVWISCIGAETNIWHWKSKKKRRIDVKILFYILVFFFNDNLQIFTTRYVQPVKSLKARPPEAEMVCPAWVTVNSPRLHNLILCRTQMLHTGYGSGKSQNVFVADLNWRGKSSNSSLLAIRPFWKSKVYTGAVSRYFW